MVLACASLAQALAHLEESEVEIMDKLAFKSLTGRSSAPVLELLLAFP